MFLFPPPQFYFFPPHSWIPSLSTTIPTSPSFFFSSSFTIFIIFPVNLDFPSLQNFIIFPPPPPHLFYIYFHPQIHRPSIDPTSISHRPLHRPHIDPTLTPYRNNDDPRLTFFWHSLVDSETINKHHHIFSLPHQHHHISIVFPPPPPPPPPLHFYCSPLTTTTFLLFSLLLLLSC